MTLVLVTGGSGYVASHVIRILLEEGLRVRATVRSLKDEKKVKHINELCPGAKHPVELVEADLTSEAGWDRAVEGCTYVHHVAGPMLSADPPDENDLLKPHVDGTITVLRACVRAGCVKRVVYTSATFSIATAAGKVPSTEEDNADLKYPNLPLINKAKILAEKALWDFVDNLPDSQKFEVAVVNPAGIMGPVLQYTQNLSSFIIKRVMEKDIPALPQFYFPMVDVRDVALAHFRCMTVPEAAGHRHILYSDATPFVGIAKILEKEFKPLGYDVPTKGLPGFLVSFKALFDKNIKTRKGIAGKPHYFDNTRMTKVLGIRPIQPEQTFIDMGHSLIKQEFVFKTPKYKPRQ